MVDIISSSRFMLCEMLTAHRKSFKRRLVLRIFIFVLITILTIIAPLSCLKELLRKNNNSTKTICFAVIGFMGVVWLASLSFLIYGYYQRKLLHQIFNSIFNQVSEPIVWRLEGNEWINFVEHIYGRNQASYFRKKFFCWCCRRELVADLTAQGSGYIVLVENAILLDRFFLYYLNKNPIHECQLVTLENQHIVLRLFFQSKSSHNLTKQNADQVSTNYRQTDIFIPKIYQEPRERLDQVVALVNAPISTNVKNVIPNFNEIRALFAND